MCHSISSAVDTLNLAPIAYPTPVDAIHLATIVVNANSQAVSQSSHAEYGNASHVGPDGTSVTYTCQAANSYSSQQFRGSAGSTTEIATALKGAIEDTNGHNGKILVSQASNVLTLTQAVSGEAGNTDFSNDEAS